MCSAARVGKGLLALYLFITFNFVFVSIYGYQRPTDLHNDRTGTDNHADTISFPNSEHQYGVKSSYAGVKTQGVKSSYSGVKTGGVKTGGVKTGSVKTGGVKTSSVKTSSVKSSSYLNYSPPHINSYSQSYSAQAACSSSPSAPTNSRLNCADTKCQATCLHDYKFPNGRSTLELLCVDGRWEIQGTEWPTMPPCEPVCIPSCQNQGICVMPGVCSCPRSFSGPRCQFEQKPCVNYPPLPTNSYRSCTAASCTITCADRHQFPDGSSIANLICKEGAWVPTRADWVSVPDCKPVCSPPCQNGGACLSLNTCQCPPDFRGPQCQYSASACSVSNLGFNGGYKCSGNNDKFQCRLSCPDGVPFSSTPAEIYTCLFSEGKFMPEPIPQCQIGSNQVLIQGASSTSTNYKTKTWRSSSHGYSQAADHPEMTVQTIKTGGTYSGINSGSSYINKDSNIGHETGGYYGLEADNLIAVKVNTPKPGCCFTWGGAHFKTFDGKVYSFQSPCRHVLVRDSVDHLFSVVVKSKRCDGTTPCSSEISIFLQDKEYNLLRGADGGILLKTSKRILPIPTQLPGLGVTMDAHNVLVTLDAAGAKLKWDTQQLVEVEASESLWNRTEGLCGVLDGDEDTDFLTKDGGRPRSISTLADSWQIKKIGEVCNDDPTEQHSCTSKADSIATEADKFCKNLIAKSRFQACAKIMDITLLLESCKWDYCGCQKDEKPETCACNSLAVYAGQCVLAGVQSLKHWRDEDTCPITCTGGKIYMACGPEQQPSCGSATTVFKSNTNSCSEGCFCPESTFLHEGKCILKEDCPCILRGRTFPKDAVVQKDCNTCKCVGGDWACTSVACGARCGAVGDPHYTTFDGRRYDFMGTCSYYLVKGPDYTVEVENVACSGAISEAMNIVPKSSVASSDMPSCTKEVTIRSSGVEIHLKQKSIITLNGQDVTKLPAKAANITIRAASSLFVIVKLPNGMEIWWDGMTRVYVDVPAAFRGKTQGLCGTFNQNQKDDFLTPEGDVEQAVFAFANKWKTNEHCDNIPEREPAHPCTLNVQNKATAEQMCSKLKSQLFEGCHWFVDVEAYYQDCLYDMCACDTDVEQCLCPILGAYAMECATKGVKIEWRMKVKECELQCGRGQSYQVCADSCLRTCWDVAQLEVPDAQGATCQPRCAEGCSCPVGEALDDHDECVPIGQCPCHYEGLIFQPGYKEVRPGRKERELCRCTNAKWHCSPATSDDIKQYPRAADIKDRCSAAAHQEFTTCEPVEPLTCKNMHIPQSSSIAHCKPGCQCAAGYVLDTVSKNCVERKECPCHHGGRSYPDGHHMQEECNTCECKSGKWACTERSCDGVCSAWGDSHFSTFDGQRLDFQGVCTYLMAKGTMESEDDSFSVEIQNEACGTTGATCSKSVTLKVGTGDKMETITFTKDDPLPDASILERIKLRVAGQFVFADVPSLGVVLRWDKATRVYVQINPKWKSRIKGLCGNYNNDARDDFQTPAGGITEASALLFADSWRLQNHCPQSTEVHDHCEERPSRHAWATKTCGLLKQSSFSPCHSEVPPGAFVSRCERDACACDAGGDCECVCTAMAAYADACAARGVILKWRTHLLCPMQCDEECSMYNPCVSTCPEENCDNTLYYEEIKKICSQETCVEGCKHKKICPEGQVFSNSSMSECVSRGTCRPSCQVSDGRLLLEGEIMEEDACHTCRCSRGKKICTGQPCATIPPPVSTPSTPVQHEEKVKCTSGWSAWINRDSPADIVAGVKTTNRVSIDNEPLPSIMELVNTNGSGVCENNKMTEIECRTVKGHQSAKETGLDVECSLESGLKCRQPAGSKPCKDFEIRVLCSCQDTTPRPLLLTAVPTCDSTRPNHEHPTECSLFYQCAPGAGPAEHPDLVLKTCGPGMFYNPNTMNCDWKETVIAVRPLCRESTKTTVAHTTPQPTTPTSAVHKSSSTSSQTEQTRTTVTSTTTAKDACQYGQVWSDCAVSCTRLCHYYKQQMQRDGKCLRGQTCIPGCIDRSVADKKCDGEVLWRDPNTCVSVADCTCYSKQGKPVKPGEVKKESVCELCQCHDNHYTCDASQCAAPVEHVPQPAKVRPSVESLMVSKTPHRKDEADKVIIVVSTATPPPECNPDSYIDLLWGDQPLNDDAFTASSVLGGAFGPYNSKLNGKPSAKSVTYPLCDSVIRPNHEHSSDCSMFYQCAPAMGPPEHPDLVLKSCGPDMFYNPQQMVCDWKKSVIAIRPECGNTIRESDDREGGSWSPNVSDDHQFVEVKLPRKEPVYGIVMQGSAIYDQYITSYNVMYGDDGVTYSYVKDYDNKPKTFNGPIDHDTPVKQMFDVPVEAVFVRVNPRTWHDAIAARFELIGCRQDVSTTQHTTAFNTTVVSTTTVSVPQCSDVLGLGKGTLPLDNISVSSEKQGSSKKYLDIRQPKAWSPLYSAPGTWVQFDFTGLRNVTGLVTKGGQTGWVTAYEVFYSTDAKTWSPVLKMDGSRHLFLANFDHDTPTTNTFQRPLHARYLKVVPNAWNKHIEMRVEPVGCFVPYKQVVKAVKIMTTTSTPAPLTTISTTPSTVYASTTPTTPYTTTTSTTTPSTTTTTHIPCSVCPGAVASADCKCREPQNYFDGEECVTRAQCPCFVGHMSYPVGVTYEGLHCEDCTCKLGGISDCKPKTCPKCAPELIPKMIPGCKCSCVACPADSRACPTSGVCVARVSWCDGVQDCPDDEADCTTTTFVTTPPTTTTPPPAKREKCAQPTCPPGYKVVIKKSRSYPTADRLKNVQLADASLFSLPPPPPRKTYMRYYKGGSGSRSSSAAPGVKTTLGTNLRRSDAIQLSRPAFQNKTEECPQYKCLSDRPLPKLVPGLTTPPMEPCSVPVCPPEYKIRLDTAETLQNECPKYTCDPPPKRDAVCNVTGRTFNTFDGMEYKFDICDHLLARDATADKWGVIVQKNCTKLGGCARELLIIQDGNQARLLPSLAVEYNGYHYTVEQVKAIGVQAQAFTLSRVGNTLLYQSAKYGFWVMYDQQGDIKIGVAGKLSGLVDGLCGYFDGAPENDRRRPDGSAAPSTEALGAAWARPDLPPGACEARVCPLDLQAKAWDMCNVVLDESFAACNKVFDVSKWRTRCLESICSCAQSVDNGTAAGGDLKPCLCELLQTFVAECQAADRSIDLSGWRAKRSCPASCPPPLVHHDCYRRSCEPACPEGGAPEACPPAPGVCFPGCYCPEGTLRRGDQCIKPEECRDCVCDGLGDQPKYVTFEKQELPFSGNCTYIVARDKSDKAQHQFQAFVTNGACESNKDAVCAEALHVTHGDHVLHIKKTANAQKLQVTVDGVPIYKFPFKNSWVELKSLSGNDISLLIPTAQLEVSSAFKSMSFNVRVPSHLYANRTEGLCGNCADTQQTLVKQDGQQTDDVQQFGLSWLAPKPQLERLGVTVENTCVEKPKNECLPLPPEQDPCLKLFDAEKFGQCHPVVDPVPFMLSCQEELCSDPLGACGSLERYARECLQAGICVDWRSPHLCPLTCEGDLQYKACGLGCSLTCDNYDDMTSDPRNCPHINREGCFCPDGQVLMNNTCISHTKCFPCDADEEHYAGDQWQVDACTVCSCARSSSDAAAHVSCVKQSCATGAACPGRMQATKLPVKAGDCCPEFICVPEAIETPHCKEPQTMSCGFGQELKLENMADGCPQFVCKCKPIEECEKIDEPKALEPGMEHVIDKSGCCPRAKLHCNQEKCPSPPKCANFKVLETITGTGACCPKHVCVPPSDKCLYELEFEAAPKGGERRRNRTETALKSIGVSWLDGPCRSCSCRARDGSPPVSVCSLTQCPPLATSQDFLIEPQWKPYTCCPQPIYTACKHDGKVYKLNEKWISPYDPCRTHKCEINDEGKLERRTTIKQCETDCQPGWEYVRPTEASGECCGVCQPVSCVVDGTKHAIGEEWTSPDHCERFTCLNNDGSLQVQGTIVNCPVVSTAMLEEFQYEEKSVPGECCSQMVQQACKVGDVLYEEGASWRSADPCKNVTCVRDATTGLLTKVENVESCGRQCAVGFEYREPHDADVCCGHCHQVACVLDGQIKEPGSTWSSADNCTTFSCSALGGAMLVSRHAPVCPDVRDCPRDHLYTDGCCQHCNQTVFEQNLCTPIEIRQKDTIGLVRHGSCVNREAIVGLVQCKGVCDSGTVYNAATGSFDSDCQCCQATSYQPLTVELHCDDGSTYNKKFSIPKACSCKGCVDAPLAFNITRVKTAGVKTAAVKTAGVKTAGVKTAGVKTAGVKTAGVKTAGVKTAGVKTAGVKTAGVKTSGVKNSPKRGDLDVEMMDDSGAFYPRLDARMGVDKE